MDVETPEKQAQPHLVDGKYSIKDLIDIEHLRRVLESFSAATGFTTGFVSFPDQELLIHTGWRDVCVKFHRALPESEQVCKKSNLYLTEQLKAHKELNLCPCDHGLVDGATPVIIKGVHVASLATGQILLEQPDPERFREQARRFGYDEEAYLQALDQVPVVSEVQFRAVLTFLSELAVMIAEMGLSSLRMRDSAAVLQQEYLDRCQAEQALQESEKKYRNLIQHSSDAIYLLYNDKFEVVNNRFLEMLKVSIHDLNEPDFDFMTLVAPRSRPLILERAERIAAGEEPENRYEFTALSSTGAEIEVEASVSHIPYKDGVATQGILRDVSNRRRLERQLRQAQKMEALGRLAGGVAHDFNNLLSPILGYSEMLLLELAPDDPRHNDLEAIQQAGLRARDQVCQLLAFSRKQVLEMVTLDLGQSITGFREIFRRTVREDIEMEFRLAPEPLNIRADVTQIDQILMNLAVNAQDAMPRGGCLVIETAAVTLDEEHTADYPDARIGPHVVLTVRDSGQGMEEETLKHLFEPFYTTKPQGKGTGLGLATVHGIVRQHGGHIAVESGPGAGSIFRIYFPRTEQCPDCIVRPASDPPPTGLGETVLVVEDDSSVRSLVRSILQKHGYRVLEADCADTCLALLKHHDGPLDLLLSDVVMPGMSGLELYQRISDRISGLKVIFMTGYSDELVDLHGQLRDGMTLIKKPITVQSLTVQVRQILDQ